MGGDNSSGARASKTLKKGFRPELFTVPAGTYDSNLSYGAGTPATHSFVQLGLQLPSGTTTFPLTANPSGVTIQSKSDALFTKRDSSVTFTIAITINTNPAVPGGVAGDEELRIRTLQPFPPSPLVPGRYLQTLPLQERTIEPLFWDVSMTNKNGVPIVPAAFGVNTVIAARLLDDQTIALLLNVVGGSNLAAPHEEVTVAREGTEHIIFFREGASRQETESLPEPREGTEQIIFFREGAPRQQVIFLQEGLPAEKETEGRPEAKRELGASFVPPAEKEAEGRSEPKSGARVRFVPEGPKTEDGGTIWDAPPKTVARSQTYSSVSGQSPATWEPASEKAESSAGQVVIPQHVGPRRPAPIVVQHTEPQLRLVIRPGPQETQKAQRFTNLENSYTPITVGDLAFGTTNDVLFINLMGRYEAMY